MSITTKKPTVLNRGALDLCLFEISGVSIALEMNRVSKFVDQDDNESRWETIDIALRLGLSVHTTESFRQKALVEGNDHQLALVLGTRIRIEPVTISNFHRLPRIIQGIEGLTGICGIILQGNICSFLLDIDYMLQHR